MKYFNGLLFAVMTVLLASCATKNVSYFQDVETEQTIQMAAAQKITLKPGDKVSIIVNSKDAQLADLFNLSIVTHRTGYSSDVLLNSSQQVSAYTLDGEGCIDFPQLGKLCLKGMERPAVADMIKEKLIASNLVKDPVVIVEFMNLQVSVLGEVARPGRFSIGKDEVTVLDAISMAGDLTIFGQRDNVRLLRTENGVQKTYILDLTSDSALVKSPAYYMQQNDVVYVTPNKKKSRESTVNGNNVLSTSFWISLASLAASVTSIIVR